MYFFFIFYPSKIHVSLTGIVSYLFSPRCHLSSDRCHHATVPCHASFSWSQVKLAASASCSDNALSHRLLSQAETITLNSHHFRWPPSSDILTPTLHCYNKKIISILATLPITQSHLYFASSLARVHCHQSSTRRRCSLSPSSHAHRSSTQRYPRWWISRLSFASWITYQHVHSCKKIF
jgi:hypothetical protein